LPPTAATITWTCFNVSGHSRRKTRGLHPNREHAVPDFAPKIF